MNEDCKLSKSGWTCSIMEGWEIKVPPDDFCERMVAARDDDEKIEIIETFPNLKEPEDGQHVLVMSLFGWAAGNVRLGGDFMSSPHVESGGHVFPMQMAEDDRACWITSVQINKKVIRSARNP